MRQSCVCFLVNEFNQITTRRFVLPATVYSVPAMLARGVFCMFVCLGSRIWLSECLCSRPAAPGGKLRPVLQLHAGLQKWLPEHSAGHHGESTHTQEAFSDMQTFRLFPWCRRISLSVWTRSLCGISLAISSEYRQKLPSQGEHINCLQLQACSVLG